ncbi:dTDP-4-dehydrorhamnose 3,5-epimerase family protein, partial [Rahnella victoriana]
ADFEYKCTEFYSPGHEKCLLWNDPDIGVNWPVDAPVLSAKDKLGMRLKELAQ